MKKIFTFFTILSLIFLANGNNPAFAKDSEAKKLIVTSFYPLAFMAEQITGNKAEIINLAGSTDVHGYEPSPQDMVKLNKADLVVFQGAELEAWTNGIIPDLKSKGITTLEVTHDLELAKAEDHDEHKDGHKDEHKKEKGAHHDDEKQGDHKEDGHDEHHHGEFDPHTWLDPIIAQKMADKILQSMISTDSANEAFYKANASVLKARFANLDKDFTAGLSQCANKELIISHDAYGYLASRYGFKTHTIAGFSPDDQPSAKILAELKKEAKEGITHILIEENSIRRFADTLARETGLATLPANPLGRGTLDPKKDFFDVMKINLNSFKTALNCK